MYKYVVPNIGTMSFIRYKTKTLASGEKRKYYSKVENYRKDGKVKQRILKYLGTSPFQTKFDLEPKVAIELAKILSDGTASIEEITERLEAFGIHPPPGELKDVELIFSPGQRKLAVHIHYAR